MNARQGPTVRARRLGNELRRLRRSAGLTIDLVAERLECSTSKISRIETGHTGVTPRDMRDMLSLYGVAGRESEELLHAAREARKKGWWSLYGLALTGAYVGLEQQADWIRAYEAQSVSGLLQTERYARTLVRTSHPDVPDDDVERRVRLRMHRQSLLTNERPLQLHVVLDEAVLRRVVGPPSVMREQCDHLLMCAKMPNITLQVLPFAAGAHRGLDGAFVVLGYAESDDLDIVFAEHAAGGLFLEKQEELRRYMAIFEALCAQALPPDRSVDFIAEAAETMERGGAGEEEPRDV